MDGADEWTRLGARRSDGHGGRRGRRPPDLPHRRHGRSAPCRYRPVAGLARIGIRVVLRCGGDSVHPVPPRVRTDRVTCEPAHRNGDLRCGTARDGGGGVVDGRDVRLRGTGGHRDGADPHRIECPGGLARRAGQAGHRLRSQARLDSDRITGRRAVGARACPDHRLALGLRDRRSVGADGGGHGADRCVGVWRTARNPASPICRGGSLRWWR